jgi:hypothetical protein
MKLDEKTLINLAYIKRASRDMILYSYLINIRKSEIRNKLRASVSGIYSGYQKVKPKPKFKSKRTLDEILLGNPDENDIVALLKVFAFIALRLALIFIYMPINFVIVLFGKIFKK